MVIAITGDTGFIGSALVKHLSKRKNITLFPFDKHKHSLSSVASLKDFVENKDAIIHLAGISNSRENCYIVNTLGTANLLEAISLYGKSDTHLIYASSFAVYEENVTTKKLSEEKSKTLPRNHYGMSKIFAEELIKFYNRNYHLKSSILRIANPYGPSKPKIYNGVIALLIDKIYKREPIIINGDGAQVRDFIFIEDLTKAFIKVLKSQEDFLLVNICTGKEMQIIDLVRKIESLMNKNAILSFNKAHAEKGYWIGNPKKAQDKIHFSSTTDIDRGLLKTIQWYIRSAQV